MLEGPRTYCLEPALTNKISWDSTFSRPVQMAFGKLLLGFVISLTNALIVGFTDLNFYSTVVVGYL